MRRSAEAFDFPFRRKKVLCLVGTLDVGRGDFARQREMVVPIVLLCFAVGVRPALRRPRLLLVAYLFYLAILGAGIAYHRGTLRARGLACLASSPAPRAAGSLRGATG